MIVPAKIDSNSITRIKEKGIEAIVDWFDQHKQSFYTLGWFYLGNQQQMGELFYRSIMKANKELPRFKGETSFETWVTSIFIHTCRQLYDHSRFQAAERGEPSLDLFKALDQLKVDQKEAMLLTYIKGISKEEAAQILQVSVEKMKGLLFTGIQSLKKQLGYEATFNGCKEYHKDYIDYLERTMERPKKVDFEIHIYHCQNCQEDLAAFQDVMLTLSNLAENIDALHVPSDLLVNVKDRLAEEEQRRRLKNKKRNRIGLIFTGAIILLISIGFFTGTFRSLYYTWTEEDEELRAFLQHDLGERLNLEAESNGLKIKIKSAIADDVQTLVFYEIEDKKEENQYMMMNNDDGVLVENESEIMGAVTYPKYYLPDLKSKRNNERKNVYQGKISLPPLSKDDGTIKLRITKLYKLIRDSSDWPGFVLRDTMEYESGEWNFKIPVKKQPSHEYALDKETEVEGIQVRFDKLIIAPTSTILLYAIHDKQPEKRIDVLNIDKIEVNNKKVKADMFGSSFLDSQEDENWNTFQTQFDPVFGEKPVEVNIDLNSAHLTFEDPKTIELDASKKYPQTFQYAGSTISIDKLEVGKPTKIVISNHEIKNRAYESLQFRILDKDENEPSSMEGNAEGVVVDKNGVEYDTNDSSFSYEKIEQPRYFVTVQSMELHHDDNGKTVIPKKLEIDGYQTTKYLDKVVKISLN